MAATAILFKTGKFAISGAFKILFKRIQIAKILYCNGFYCSLCKVFNYREKIGLCPFHTKNSAFYNLS